MRHHRALRRQLGVGLIEVLIAVLILSIGLLGIGLVQTRALSNNNSSMGRSMATVASYSILDAIRADRSNLAAYETTVTADSCDDPDDAGSLAEYQLSQWCIELGQTLGEADTTTGTVECTDGQCTVTIQFDDSRIGAGGSDAQTVITQALL